MFEEATSDIFCDETECDSKVDGMLPYSKTGKDGINTSRKERALFCLQQQQTLRSSSQTQANGNEQRELEDCSSLRETIVSSGAVVVVKRERIACSF